MNIIELHKDLVKIPSHESVEEVRDYIMNFLTDAVIDEYGNIISEVGKGEPHIILNTHMDTVPPHIDFSENNQYICGRGSCDAKGPLSVFLNVFDRLKNIDGRISLVITPDEETTTNGAYNYVQNMDTKVESVIVGEPTDLQVCLSSKGYVPMKITVKGEEKHSSEENIDNAVVKASDIINILSSISFQEDNENPLGKTVVQPTVINSDDTINQTPSNCEIHLTARTTPNNNYNDIKRRIRNEISNGTDFVEDDYTISTLNKEPVLKSFETETNNISSELIKNSRGIGYFNAATESSHFIPKTRNIMVFGPGDISYAHTKEEKIKKEDVKKAENILYDSLNNII